jgi:hypothetical protein
VTERKEKGLDVGPGETVKCGEAQRGVFGYAGASNLSVCLSLVGKMVRWVGGGSPVGPRDDIFRGRYPQLCLVSRELDGL